MALKSKTKEQLKAELLQLEERNNLNNAILENIEKGIALVKTEDSTFLYTNPQFDQMFGFQSGALLASSVEKIRCPLAVDNDQLYSAEVHDALTHFGVWRGESQLAKQDGSLFWCRMNVTKFNHPEHGEVWVSIHEDINNQKELELKLRQAQKMEALGVLVGGVAHEFNNLLTPISAITELMLRYKEEEDPDNKRLKQIKSAANKAKDLIQQLLAYSRHSSLKRERINLEEVLEDTLRLLSNTALSHITIEKVFEENLPPIFGNANEIHQVLLNLFINASHAMPEGGEISVRVRRNLVRDGICMTVSDTGIGMDRATLERIFDPFFTTKAIGLGTGLGLSVVQGIIEQHDGQIVVESSLGQGTTFKVFLPSAHQPAEEVLPENSSIDIGAGTILLVDNEADVIAPTKEILEELGYRVRECQSSKSALSLFAEEPNAFDLIITDYSMPELNGRELTTAIKALRADIPVILLSGHGALFSAEEIKSWRVDDLLVKPFTLQKLSQVVKRALDESKASTASIG